MTPTFTIITVVFNDIEGLKRTEESVRSQIYDDFEWVIIDGASSDGTAEYAGAMNLPRLRAVSEPDNGIYDAMNKGLHLANGVFVVFMNAGDCFEGPNTLAVVAPHALSSANLIYGSSITMSDKKHEKKPLGHRAFAYGMFACHQAMYFRTALAKKIGYQPTFKVAGDYDFSARFLLSCKEGVLYIDAPLAIFWEGGRSYSHEGVGRAENLIVQQSVLRLPKWKLSLIQATYRLTSLIRRQLPAVYGFLRGNA